MSQKVMVESLTNGSVSINIPDLKLKREWERKGSKKPIEFEVLEQAIYDPGVEFMFRQGILNIDDMKVKIALGLEEEGAVKPVNTIVLTDIQKRRLLTIAPIDEFKEQLKTLPQEQILSLIDYAIENEITNMDKCDLLKKVTQVDIIKAIQLNRQDKEE